MIDWISSVFTDVESEMCGLEWGRLYEQYHKKAYDSKEVSAEVRKLYGDPYIKNRKGILSLFSVVLLIPKLLEVRIFDEATKNQFIQHKPLKRRKRRIKLPALHYWT